MQRLLVLFLGPTNRLDERRGINIADYKMNDFEIGRAKITDDVAALFYEFPVFSRNTKAPFLLKYGNAVAVY